MYYRLYINYTQSTITSASLFEIQLSATIWTSLPICSISNLLSTCLVNKAQGFVPRIQNNWTRQSAWNSSQKFMPYVCSRPKLTFGCVSAFWTSAVLLEPNARKSNCSFENWLDQLGTEFKTCGDSQIVTQVVVVVKLCFLEFQALVAVFS